MDIYRFFHPHHNPRLINTSVRQQELSELEQAAAELRKALERMQQRITRRPVTPIMSEHFTDLIKAMNFVEKSMQTLSDAHKGDSIEDFRDLINERSECSGWENWSNILREQLESTNSFISTNDPQNLVSKEDLQIVDTSILKTG